MDAESFETVCTSQDLPNMEVRSWAGTGSTQGRVLVVSQWWKFETRVAGGSVWLDTG